VGLYLTSGSRRHKEDSVSVIVNWDAVGMGLILLALAAVTAGAWCFCDSRRLAAEENRQRRAFEKEMAAVRLPDWNGDTYDWPEGGLADYLEDAYAYGPADTLEMPVPDSVISGPMPVQPVSDEAFMARLRADNTAFLASLEHM
jgi:hypothetical protein